MVHERQQDEGRRQASTDRALVRLDEAEVKSRVLDAFDGFLQLGFAVHLIGVKARAAVEYRVALYSDGVDSIPGEKLQELADEYRLDFTIEVDPGVDGWVVMFYPRW